MVRRPDSIAMKHWCQRVSALINVSLPVDRRLALTLCVLSATARQIDAQTTQVRDSAGVRVVVHSAPPSRAIGIRLSETPYLSLGGLHDDVSLEFSSQHFFLTAAHLSDGRAVVLDENSLKWFDAKGVLSRVSGRFGSGPGEFRKTRDLCVLRGDTVMVIEENNGRVSLWSPTGRYIRQFERSPGFKPFDTCRADGTLVTRTDLKDGTVHYRTIRPDDATVANLGPIAVPRYRSPFTTEPNVLPVPAGYAVSDARRYEYWVVDLKGRTRQIVRVGGRPAKMTEAEWIAAAMRVFPSSREASMRLATGDPLRTPPAFSAMRADSRGRVWIRDYDRPYGWTVFSADGALIGRIMLSGSIATPTRDILRVAADYAVVRRVGPDGEVFLDFHRIIEARQ